MPLIFHNFVLSFSLSLLLASSVTLPESATYLLRFRDNLSKSSQRLLPWNLTNSPSFVCEWAGVACHPNSTFLIKSLNLSGLGLSGTLNDSIYHLCSLTDLQYLDFSGNNFTGKIPPVLGNCSQLDTIFLNGNGFEGSIPPQIFRSKRFLTLDLGYNSLTGQIPAEISQCTNLEYVGLYNNFLSGNIPPGLFSLPNLKSLYLHANNLSGELPDFPPNCAIFDLWIHGNSFSGSLPHSLSYCHNLTKFFASNNNFKGIIPPDIFKSLLQLEILYLDGNKLEGGIPETLWDLEKLQELVLSGNNLNGTISERIGELEQLTAIAIADNNLFGQIPRTIGSLQNLNYLILFGNKLQGPLPPELGNCSSLTELRLQNNLIDGMIPTEICELENLQIFYLFNNRIEGHMPHQIGKMNSLLELAMYNNSLNGTIPSEITSLKNLTFLSLAHNNLTGEVPFGLRKNDFPGLVKLDLTGNQFYGPVPTYLCYGNSLSVLDLGSNRFNDTFPVVLGNCSSIKRVILSNNLLQGSLPSDLDQNHGISYLDIRGNLLEGTIPEVLGYWSNLTMLDLSENRFSGSIPAEIGKLENLRTLKISSNKLTGRIPSDLGNCKKMLTLDLSNNHLSGTIPSDIITSVELQTLLLQDNELDGEVPNSFTSTQNLRELQLGNNMLQGTIPCSLDTLNHFSSALNLSHNKLSGEIPSCLSSLDKLQILDLSSNSFSGQIPVELDDMISLSFVNISFNQLSGKLPVSWMQLISSNPDSSLGNPLLCDEDLSCSNVEKKSSRRGHLLVVAGIVIGVIFSVALVCFVIHRFLGRCLGKEFLTNQSLLQESQRETKDLPEDLSFKDIMRAIEGYAIGKGKHGTVYRTESANLTKSWAVKKVNLSERSSFSTETSILRLIRHRNIVKMAGYCIKDGYGFIVTEYMQGGTLFEILHRSETRLVWGTRYRIALGIAEALCYLHHDCMPQIIHRDVKSDNVLMDSEFEPKVGDFGLAKQVSVSDDSLMESNIVGTLGYIAPENAYTTQLTEKGDVYSYGVILLELVCRKMPVDPQFEEGLDIVTWTRKNLGNDDAYIYFVDQEIYYWDRSEQLMALKLLELALQCTEFLPSLRPSMRDVVGSLLKLNGNNERRGNSSQSSRSQHFVHIP